MGALSIGNSKLGTDANLVAYYKLEDVNDSKGTNTLTNNNSVGFSAGTFSNAADFTATNTNKNLSVNNNLGLTGGGSISVLGWFNFYNAPGVGTKMGFISTEAVGTPNIVYQLAYFNSAGVLQLYFDRLKQNIAHQAATYNITLGTGSWYMFTFTYDGTNGSIFLNGTAVGSAALSGTGAANSTMDNTSLGMIEDSGGTSPVYSRPSSCLLDDVGFFNRALTTTEINNHWLGSDSLPAAAYSSFRSLSGVGI